MCRQANAVHVHTQCFDVIGCVIPIRLPTHDTRMCAGGTRQACSCGLQRAQRRGWAAASAVRGGLPSGLLLLSHRQLDHKAAVSNVQQYCPHTSRQHAAEWRTLVHMRVATALCNAQQAQHGKGLVADAAAASKSQAEFLVTGVLPRPAGAALVDDWDCLRVSSLHLALGSRLSSHGCCLTVGW